MTSGQWVLVVALVIAVGFGVYRLAVDGRFRGTHKVRGAAPAEAGAPSAGGLDVLADTEYAGQLGERATLVQFSSAFCAPCRVARRVLADIAHATPGVLHIEIDAEHHLALVRRLGVQRTPTTLVLDPHGREVTRAAGAPTTAQVLTVLGQLS